jgi:ribosomal RNA-processing protein 7
VAVKHVLYVKPNESKQFDLPKGKTLFMLNIPMDATEDTIRYLFRNQGIIERIKFSNQKHPGCACHVVFADAESITSVLEMETGEWQSGTQGTEKYLGEISAPDIDSLKEKVDEAMELFENQEMEKKMQERNRNLIDDDGFILVTKSKRKSHVDGSGTAIHAISKDDAEKPKPKEKGLVDFYRFQMREKKRNELAELRKKFEQDKKKIVLMKQQRRFKPF